MRKKQWVQTIIVAGTALFGQDVAATEITDESIIESTYDAWVIVTNAKDIESWSSYLAPNAVFTPPGDPPLQTKEAILDYYRNAFADPNFVLDCQQLSVDVARSRDMAWARGRCNATFSGQSGEKAHGISRWFKIWLKQPDGSWKCSINTWNYQDE
jgi:ketosteroid isomerase-like protein